MIPIPTIPRAYLLAGVVALAALVVANTYRLSAAVDREHAKLVTCAAEKQRLEATVTELRGAITEQNSAVDSWKQTAAAAQERAAKALEQVDAAEASRRAVSARLDAFQRAAGESECEATRRLLLEYRR